MNVVYTRKEGVSSPHFRSLIWIQCGLDTQVCSSLLPTNTLSVFNDAMSEMSAGLPLQPLPGSAGSWTSQEGAPIYTYTHRDIPAALGSPVLSHSSLSQASASQNLHLWSQEECLPCKPHPQETWSGCTETCFWARCLWAEGDSEGNSFP